MDLGTVLRQARERLGLRQIDLARRLRVKQSSISQWESGKHVPDIGNRIALAAELRIALQDIMPEAEEVPPDTFTDPQVLRLVANFSTLDAQQRSMIDLLVLQLRERNAADRAGNPPPDSPRPPRRSRRR